MTVSIMALSTMTLIITINKMPNSNLEHSATRFVILRVIMLNVIMLSAI